MWRVGDTQQVSSDLDVYSGSSDSPLASEVKIKTSREQDVTSDTNTFTAEYKDSLIASKITLYFLTSISVLFIHCAFKISYMDID